VGAWAACIDAETAMTRVAGQYVRLVLAVGVHDADYVDAYYGPPEWREEAVARARSLEEIDAAAASLLAELRGLPSTIPDEPLQLRRAYLLRQTESLRARVEMLQGRRMTFDQESRALYDAVAPTFPESHFEGLIAALDSALPPPDSARADSSPRSVGVRERFEMWSAEFLVPAERLDTVFVTAIGACRERTARHLALPEGERFRVEYVTGKTWSAYNWYQGNFQSLIQVNVDLPITIDRAVDLACHEGYPGHHVYNVLLELHLVRERGWIEFSVYPLFSPQSLIAEGSANFGVDIAFPAGERLAFERDVLFPLAGLDSSAAETYARVRAMVDRLSFAGNEAARKYLDGEIDATEAARWLERYALMSPERARQRVRFIEQYRSYVINYNLGRDLVARFVDARAPGGVATERWAAFGELLASPRVASTLDGAR
jgi:hypothetical protein